MRWWQVMAALKGYHQEKQHAYDAARLQAWLVLNSFRSKDQEPFSPQQLLRFPWEKEQPSKTQTKADDEAIRQLLAKVREENSLNGF